MFLPNGLPMGMLLPGQNSGGPGPPRTQGILQQMKQQQQQQQPMPAFMGPPGGGLPPPHMMSAGAAMPLGMPPGSMQHQMAPTVQLSMAPMLQPRPQGPPMMQPQQGPPLMQSYMQPSMVPPMQPQGPPSMQPPMQLHIPPMAQPQGAPMMPPPSMAQAMLQQEIMTMQHQTATMERAAMMMQQVRLHDAQAAAAGATKSYTLALWRPTVTVIA